MTSAPSSETVLLENLDSSMVIEKYTGFTSKFTPMDEDSCKWLQHNFKGVKAEIKRDSKQQHLLINSVKAGDTLLALYDFPESLKKLTIVNDRLINELKKRGFKRFLVKRIKRKLTPQQVRRREAVARSTELIDKARDGVKISAGASRAVEDMIDSTREGRLDSEAVSQYVDHILKSESTEALGVLSSLKQSDQTYAHCVDVGAIFQCSYMKLMKKRRIELTREQKAEMLMGAFLHDIGKARVPKEILDSTVRFERDSHEMKLMQSHPVFGAEMLTEYGSSETIVNMAHYHHVKLDTTMKSSYPEVKSYDEVIMETRLIAIVDVYQALVGRRSYKKSWAPPAAMKFIDQLSGIEFDMEVWDEFYSILGKYPTGSLVELNDGALAFVVGEAGEDLDQPEVALIRNAKGEDLTNNTLINLADEPDIKIVKDLDNYDVLGDASLDIFTNLKIS